MPAGPGATHRGLQDPTRRPGEWVIQQFLRFSALIAVVTTAAIVASLFPPALSFFREVQAVHGVSFFEFATGDFWAPDFASPSFGVLPIVVGSSIVVVLALLVSVPVGLLSAIYLSEYAPTRVRRVIKPALEVLEGVPTVAVGLFAFWFLRPTAQEAFPNLPWTGPFAILIGGMAVGLITVPLMASVSDDAMRQVPQSLREAAYALGDTKARVAVRVVVPAAISGIVAGIVLAASRAVGETMIVLLAAGAGNPNLSFNLFAGVQTMTAFIAGKATGDIAQGTLIYDTIFAVGSLLFLVTLTLNLFAIRFVRKYREVYE
jgi:phosphate transport system permease protein